jgi:phosphotransferase system HPr (HPr) family protein
MSSVRLMVRNPSGIHMRPAGLFVRTAGRFRSTITITNVTLGRGPFNAKSLTSLLTLQASKGVEIEVSADGEDAEAALAAIREAIESGLGETIEDAG